MGRIIGLVGRAGSGKDTLAAHLVKSYGFTRRAFADPLRAATSAITGWPVSALEDRTFKETVDPRWGVTPRQFMQHLGTEGMRSLHREVWVTAFDVWFQKMGDSPVVVTDVRFQNEVDYLRANNALMVRVSRPSVDNLPVLHASEYTAWEWSIKGGGDFTVYNTSTVDELALRAREVLDLEHAKHSVPEDVIAAEKDDPAGVVLAVGA